MFVPTSTAPSGGCSKGGGSPYPSRSTRSGCITWLRIWTRSLCEYFARAALARPYIRALQLGSAHNIGSVRGSGCKARGAARGGYHGQAVQRRRRPLARIHWPAMARRLRTSEGPCQPFGTGQISPHAALSPPYWVSTQPRRLRHTFRGNLPRSRPRRLLRQAPGIYFDRHAHPFSGGLTWLTNDILFRGASSPRSPWPPESAPLPGQPRRP